MSDVTILYEPSGEPAADVVFVHGLNGDPIKSWRFDKPDSWHTWLPESLPEVRLFTVGYPARLQPVGSLMPIDERANNVLAHLTHENVGTRPVCFVAHGSGGLVVTELLRQSASCGVDYPQVALATGGVVFLPTPLKGFELARSAKLVNKFALGSSSRTFGEMAPDSQKVRGRGCHRLEGPWTGMSQAPLKKGDGDPTSIVCRGQSTGMEDHRHEQESQNRDK